MSRSLATVDDVPPNRRGRHLAVVTEPPLLEGTRAQLPLASMSPLRYPGSKRKMVPAIRQLIDANEPPPKLLVEPFCGGASVSLGLLAQDAVERVLLADFDPLVAAFWYEATTNGDALVKDMRKLEVTVDEWDRWRNMRPRSSRKKALKCLFLNRTTFSGIIGGRAGPIGGRAQESDYRIDCRFNKDAIAERILNVYSLAKEGRIVDVLSSRWQGTLDHARWHAAEYEPKETIFYLDPPYIEKADRLYDLAFDEYEHRQLAEHLRGTSHRWILSYDTEPLALGCYRGLGDIHEYRVVHHYTMTGTRSSAVPGREVLFTNLPNDPTVRERPIP
ncbi:DNA adenine methylase [[Mycobacterium] zoologicum]|uniref:DNA adenine methylase n=1 Tax=[Mycobacterium] zoologicum TaxID=2872311 RepID=UPI001CDAC5EE|nr:DNA adenine methylase [Mycolicibacter sp. MYC101]MEB3065566.1 DNA adenine methylase [Mycolicibacter sp. MYC101]